jgi:hypothetical protein
MAASHQDLDAILQTAVDQDWRKVAMVLAKARQACEARRLDVSYEDLEDRIARMVRDGRLEAQGDITKWRSSEIRRPQT